MSEMHLDDSQQECYKNILNCALAVGKMMRSDKTGFIHYYPNEEELGHSQTIPVLENVLFALALFKTHLVENVQEGKQLLKKLLHFQIGEGMEDAGNFPVFLHEYPLARDPAVGLYLLAPLFWIVKLYGHVIGSGTKENIESAAKKILEFTSGRHKASPYPYFLSVRLACAQVAFGHLWNEQERIKIGNASLDKLKEQCIDGWSSTTQLGDLLVGLAMIYPSLSSSPWVKLWNFMKMTWHTPTGTYIGPWMREWQRGSEPKPNLYDLFASAYAVSLRSAGFPFLTGTTDACSFAKRTLTLRPFHLQGVLIPPIIEHFDAGGDQGKFNHCHDKNRNWAFAVTSAMAAVVLEKKDRLDPSVEKTFTPLCLLWGDREAVHTFVCQGGRYPNVSFDGDVKRLELVFTLDPEVDVEDREKRKEIEFFIDIDSKASFTVDGKSSTTFELGKPMNIHLGALSLQIVFSVVEGEGDFLGHLMRGNRPSQTSIKGEKSFHAYDWNLFLRTIRRSSHCKIKADITIGESGCQ